MHADHRHDRPEPDHSTFYSREFWDDRYSSAGGLWSGKPNPWFVGVVTNLAPGVAVDVGCGEGGDAIALAELGWQVTGVDISDVALRRAARRAAGIGDQVSARINWRQADLLEWTPERESFDLVSAQFVHLPSPQREELHRRMADAVRPGGTLLIAGHDVSDLDTSIGRPDLPGMFFSAADVAAILDGERWTVRQAGRIPRSETDPDGRLLTIHDAVLWAVRTL